MSRGEDEQSIPVQEDEIPLLKENILTNDLFTLPRFFVVYSRSLLYLIYLFYNYSEFGFCSAVQNIITMAVTSKILCCFVSFFCSPAFYNSLLSHWPQYTFGCFSLYLQRAERPFGTTLTHSQKQCKGLTVVKLLLFENLLRGPLSSRYFEFWLSVVPDSFCSLKLCLKRKRRRTGQIKICFNVMF